MTLPDIVKFPKYVGINLVFKAGKVFEQFPCGVTFLYARLDPSQMNFNALVRLFQLCDETSLVGVDSGTLALIDLTDVVVSRDPDAGEEEFPANFCVI
jgi:hypothetical protein